MRRGQEKAPATIAVDRGFRGTTGGSWVSARALLAAVALQVVHRIDRNRVTAHAVNVVHGDPPSEVFSPAHPRDEFSLYNRNATDVIPLDVVISACRGHRHSLGDHRHRLTCSISCSPCPTFKFTGCASFSSLGARHSFTGCPASRALAVPDSLRRPTTIGSGSSGRPFERPDLKRNLLLASGHSLYVTTDIAEVDDWRKACAGDPDAFARVFDRHQARVFRHCLRLVDDLEDARDAMSSTFLEAWRRRGAVRIVEGSIIGWLLVTATNVSRNLLRTRRRYNSLLRQLPPAEAYTLEAHEPDDTLIEAVSALPRHQQEVVALCFLEGFSEAAAAASLHVPLGTVKSRLSRARANLRGSLSDPSMTSPSYEEPA